MVIRPVYLVLGERIGCDNSPRGEVEVVVEGDVVICEVVVWVFLLLVVPTLVATVVWGS